MALFESATYVIDGKEIESIEREVDVATTIIGLAEHSDDYTRSAGPSMMFAKGITDNPNHIQFIKVLTDQNTYEADQDLANHLDRETRPTGDFDIIKKVNKRFNLGFAAGVATLQGQRRQFSCAIPLHHIFGFCRNVRKVIYGAKHTIALVRRGNDNSAIWRSCTVVGVAAVGAGQVVLTKLVMWMPVMTPSITAEERLLSFMDTGRKSLLIWLTVTTYSKDDDITGFTWHLAAKQGVAAPRHIFVSLQDRARLNNQERSHMIFDQLHVNNVSLKINGQQEPTEEIQLNYSQNQIARTYHRIL
ncbi:hypothetical protein ACJMK2_033344 [Sinanodonta woodiana]|uniref:Double jelly roll-like domain-containing protein n=1 Tax=Sinanodonta woodiana TaxID=1069815 RepID=A0ABD3WN32_SINWO